MHTKKRKKIIVKKHKVSAGVTFVELMVVIAIIGIMTAVTVVSLQSSRDKKAVEVAGKQVVASIREAQNNALTGKNGNCSGGLAKASAYKVRIYNGSKYMDVKTFFSSTDSACSSDANYPNDLSYGSVRINNVNIDFTGVSCVSDCVIHFGVPFGNVIARGYGNFGGMGSDTFAKIKIKSTRSTNIFYTVCIYPSGKITDSAGDISC